MSSGEFLDKLGQIGEKVEGFFETIFSKEALEEAAEISFKQDYEWD